MSTKYNILSAPNKSCQLIFYKKYIFFYILEKMLTKFFTLQIRDKAHLLIFQTLELLKFHHDVLVLY